MSLDLSAVDYANYFESVGNIPGISGTIAKGAKTGFGVYAGKMMMDKHAVKVGYSTVLGLTASVGCKF